PIDTFSLLDDINFAAYSMPSKRTDEWRKRCTKINDLFSGSAQIVMGGIAADRQTHRLQVLCYMRANRLEFEIYNADDRRIDAKPFHEFTLGFDDFDREDLAMMRGPFTSVP
ncbi:MAG: hypothetical protein KGI97_07725, partial [Alphaproteobacteria bacterium]|nr:hypothetical protein [Alphaproteobacteria bacterium]